MTTVLLWILLTVSLLAMVGNIAKAGGWHPSPSSAIAYTVTGILYSTLVLITMLVILGRL